MKRSLLIALMVLGVAASVMALAVPATVLADAKTDICAGVGAASGTAACTNDNSQINKIIKAVINILSLVVGIVAVIMIIVSGFMYVTSGGDSGKIGTAKHTIIYAIVGLVIVALAQAIVQFVLSRV